jgi:hypothetical protein
MQGFPKSLPGGSFRITADENRHFCDAVGGDVDAAGRAHPMFYYIATQVAMGVSVGELCTMCDFDVADGPMMAQSKVEFEDELMVNVDYNVTGEISSLIRKSSRTFGEMDLLSYQLMLSRSDGVRVVHCVNEWILPRRTGMSPQ